MRNWYSGQQRHTALLTNCFPTETPFLSLWGGWFQSFDKRFLKFISISSEWIFDIFLQVALQLVSVVSNFLSFFQSFALTFCTRMKPHTTQKKRIKNLTFFIHMCAIQDNLCLSIMFNFSCVHCWARRTLVALTLNTFF